MEVDWLSRRANFDGDSIAIIDPEHNRELTYSQLNQRAEKMAAYLHRNKVMKGDRVAIFAANHISYLDLFFACAKLNAIFVPINWRLSMSEIEGILHDCDPKIVFSLSENLAKNMDNFPRNHLTLHLSHDDYEGLINNVQTIPYQANKIDPSTIAMLIYTSGTTGKPKGAMISHRHIWQNALNTVSGWGISRESVTVTTSPMFHIAGISGLVLPIFWIGGCVVIQSIFHAPQTIKYIDQYQATHVFLVPTMYHSMVDGENFEAKKLRSVQLFVSGGAPASSYVQDLFKKLELPLINSFGMTEVGPNNFYIDPIKAYDKPQSIGKPLPYIDVLLVDEEDRPVEPGERGELLLGLNHTFSGYWNQMAKTQETFLGNYIRTGDYAMVDNEGDYFIIGRKKDMIITGGENVFPTEIESVLLTHPRVKDVAVVGYADDFWGEAIGATVILEDSLNKPLSEEDLKDFLHKRLANYKVPKKILFVDAFPQTSVGKLNRIELSKLFLPPKKKSDMADAT